MPQVVAPPVSPQLSDIQLFAKAYFNLELTSDQLEVIDAVTKGKRLVGAYKPGRPTAMKVMRAYIAEGLKPGGRVRLPEHPLPPRPPKMKGVTQTGKILALIKRPGGAFNFELARVALKYSSRITDLRHEGWQITAERQYLKNGKASNTFRYRLAGQ